MAERGQLTAQLNRRMRELLDKDLSQTELRLMPYVQYCLVNGINLEPRKINAVERDALSQWRARGWLTGGASELAVSKEFWNAMCELLWLGYVVHDEQPEA